MHLVAFGPKAKRRHERAADRVVRRKLVGVDAELAQHAADAARLGVEILLHRVQRADLLRLDVIERGGKPREHRLLPVSREPKSEVAR